MTEAGSREVPCPVCGAPVPMISHFKNGANRIRVCPACSLGFVYPRASGSELLAQYSQDYFADRYDSLQQSEYVNMESWENKIALCLERVGRLRGAGTGRLLDVGCGKGWFLEAARERGWQVQGAELCAEVAQRTMERVGTQVYMGSIFDLDLPEETFDLVTMFDVIEHLETPIEALRICYRILKPGGALAISTPNLCGLGCTLLGAKAFAVWPDEHIFYFGPASIRRALRMADFADVKIASREIYPENAAALFSRLMGKDHGQRGTLNVNGPGVRSAKKMFRASPVLRGLRTAINGLFGVLPFGDELLAFALKR
jgi:2-polyprenyl-3-methyl-5-hydroxy-6-metoxy-1,4-benzoquinol methylase